MVRRMGRPTQILPTFYCSLLRRQLSLLSYIFNQGRVKRRKIKIVKLSLTPHVLLFVVKVDDLLLYLVLAVDDALLYLLYY